MEMQSARIKGSCRAMLMRGSSLLPWQRRLLDAGSSIEAAKTQAKMNEEPFMDVVVQTVLFLELCDEHTVEEDAAVAMMEQIAATLKRLEPAAKARFLKYIQSRAVQANTDEERQVLENMASNLGLAPE